MTITVYVKKGIGKDVCEDSAAIDGVVVNRGGYSTDVDRPTLVCVADGVGGNAGGKHASCFVCNSLSNTAFPPDENSIKQRMIDINDGLIEYAKTVDGMEQMATTLTALLFVGEDVFLIQAGNTRLYAARGRYLQQITKDHTTHQWLLDNGLFEEAEDCDNSEINCCLGGGRARLLGKMVVAQVFQSGTPRRLFLTSDGIHDYMNIDRLEELLLSEQDDQTIVQAVIDEAEKNESTDDKTIIIISNEGEPL